jgi:hypothetical protein
MKAYVGYQWQENALSSIGSFNPVAASAGTYCTISANNPPLIFGVSPQPYNVNLAFICTTFYGYANAGVTGGLIQLQIQLADGAYRDYGPVQALSVPGFAFAIVVTTPIFGAQFNITSSITGGSLFLEIDGLLA